MFLWINVLMCKRKGYPYKFLSGKVFIGIKICSVNVVLEFSVIPIYLKILLDQSIWYNRCYLKHLSKILNWMSSLEIVTY